MIFRKLVPLPIARELGNKYVEQLRFLDLRFQSRLRIALGRRETTAYPFETQLNLTVVTHPAQTIVDALDGISWLPLLIAKTRMRDLFAMTALIYEFELDERVFDEQWKSRLF